MPGEHSRVGQRLPGCDACTGPKSVNNYVGERHGNRELSSEFHHQHVTCKAAVTDNEFTSLSYKSAFVQIQVSC